MIGQTIVHFRILDLMAKAGRSLPSIGFIFCLCIGITSASGQRLDSIPSTSYELAGLQGPAEILIDPWGVPHIYASELYDAFYVQGFNAARDRLWQIDLWRRRGLGTLSAVFGPSFVEKDRAARLFLYRKDMYSEWLAYGSDAKRIATAFTEGVNAFVRLTRSKPELLPWEFDFLKYEPALWSPSDVVRIRGHGLVRNLRREVDRALFVREHGLKADQIRRRLEPPWETSVPEGLDLSLISEEILTVYNLATRGVSFEVEEDESAAKQNRSGPKLRLQLAKSKERSIEEAGSNNWALSPVRTSTGRPILANDPHRSQSVPSLRYISHLSAPGLDVIGAGEPALPGISIGHNQRIAFGLTIFSIDQEDLYVYRTGPGRPSEYRYRDRWEPMEVLLEEIAVKGSGPVAVELKFTRHGPVIYEDQEKEFAFAVRAAWLEPGMAPYFGSVEYMRSQNWDQFVAALNLWGAPSENQVYADVDGNIGWAPRGRAPIRPNWDGLLPVPGDGRYEWAGYYDQDQLPVEFNPERGWVATANQMNLPPDYPYRERKLGYEWASPWRMQRISEVLSASYQVTLSEMLRLQTDRLSIPARRIQSVLKELTATEPGLSSALELLSGWDALLTNESAAAALFHIWTDEKHLGRALLEQAVKADVAERIGSPHDIVLLEMVEDPSKWFSGDSIAKRNSALLDSLKTTIGNLEKKSDGGQESWRFGAFNRMGLKHPLSPVVDSDRRARIDILQAEKLQVSGTVAATGASWRQILDVGNWDNSLAMSNPGQSGDPESPYYRNLWPRWLKGEAFPLLYSREMIEAVAERRIVLTPKR